MTRCSRFIGRPTRDVIGIVCRVPHEPYEFFACTLPSGRVVPLPVPVVGDLDERGVCRCGCGFVAGGEM